MAAAISPGTGRAYGVARVCDGLGVARSSFYAWRRQQERNDPPPPPSRRGPKPAISEVAVLSAIRADLARSPWIGEGHRKVWARLRVLDGLRIARKRVLRLMRENGLLSPHRHLPHRGAAHDGRITTAAPNFVDAVIWMARTGCPWRDLPPFFGKWNSVWKRFRRWAKAGIWERILAALADDPDFESVIIDGTVIRAHQHAAGGKGRFKNERSDGRVEG